MQQEEVVARLRHVGYRMTAQRRALLDVIWGLEGHFTAERVRQAMEGNCPSVDTSTIYRTLERLVAIDAIHALVGSSPTEYERVREPHHHLICSECGRVTALADYHLDSLLHHLLEEHDFVADVTHLAIPGYCRACQPSAPPQGD